MKKIFIYYSLSGNGDVVAEYLAENKIETRKVNVIEKDILPKSTVLRILKGGFLAGIHYHAKLLDFNNDIKKYDEVIIGSPIWNGNLACPINSVLAELDLENKQVGFILYSGSGKAPKVDKYLKGKYPKSKIVHLKEPKSNNKVLKKTLKML